MASPLKLLHEWWAGIREQIALIAFTQAVVILSRMAKPKLFAWAAHINETTDRRFGPKADVVQRAMAENLEALAEALRA